MGVFQFYNDVHYIVTSSPSGILGLEHDYSNPFRNLHSLLTRAFLLNISIVSIRTQRNVFTQDLDISILLEQSLTLHQMTLNYPIDKYIF